MPYTTAQYDTAIFNAVKVVEEEIRTRIGAGPDDFGVSLVAKAMSPNDPRLVLSELRAEQDAGHALFRGAIGFLKNPQSRRFLDTDDPWRTFEALSFASLLMRLLDDATSPETS